MLLDASTFVGDTIYECWIQVLPPKWNDAAYGMMMLYLRRISHIV